MKRAHSLFNQICSYENLRTAWLKARRHKTSKKSVMAYQQNVEQNLNSLQKKLISKQYRPKPYNQFKISDPKVRIISVVPFEERVLHHAIINVLEPVFEKQFIYHTYACRKNKGVHKALQNLQKVMRKPEFKDAYYLKLDVKKYFDNINHRILKQKLLRMIKDPDCLELLFAIIDSFVCTVSEPGKQCISSGRSLYDFRGQVDAAVSYEDGYFSFRGLEDSAVSYQGGYLSSGGLENSVASYQVGYLSSRGQEDAAVSYEDGYFSSRGQEDSVASYEDGYFSYRGQEDSVASCLVGHLSSKGLPIGNLTSQFFANLYLSEFDHLITEKLHAAAYFRYMDDMIIICRNYREAAQFFFNVNAFFRDNLFMELKLPVINKCCNGIAFLGRVVYPKKVRFLSRKMKLKYRKLLSKENEYGGGALPCELFAEEAFFILRERKIVS